MLLLHVMTAVVSCLFHAAYFMYSHRKQDYTPKIVAIGAHQHN